MRILSVNARKRLGSRPVAAQLERLAATWNVGLIFAQEPVSRNVVRKAEFRLFLEVSQNSSLGAWTAPSIPKPDVFHQDGIIQALRFEQMDIYNVYLSAYSSTVREEQLRILAAIIRSEKKKPVLVVGDFNMAPAPIDGLVGSQVSSWTSGKERMAFAGLLEGCDLVDLLTYERTGLQEYSVVRTLQKAQVAFRCDLALITNEIAGQSFAQYKHETRESAAIAFTDHSAVLVEVPTIVRDNIYA